MKIFRFTCIFMSILLLCSFTGCMDNTGAPQIITILTDLTSPLPGNTDVTLSAEIEGAVAEYRWSVTGGILREADNHSAQLVKYPKMGVTPPGYDNIASVLLAAGLTFDTVTLDIVTDATWITGYNVLFINSSDDIEILGGESVLSTWVYSGGSLYLSGNAAEYLRTLWPGTVMFPSPDPYVVSTGADGEMLRATILDESSLANLNHPNVDVKYSSDDWPVIIGTAGSVDVMATVDATEILSPALIGALPPAIDPENVPAAVKFEYGKGMVIYTCFHNHSDATQLEKKLLASFTAELASHPLTTTTHGLLNNAGFFLNTEFFGFVGEDEEQVYIVQLSDTDEAYFILHSPEGILEFDINGPGDAEANVSGQPPLTAGFQEVVDGVWVLTVSGVDLTKHDKVPFVLSVGAKTEALQLVTDKPTAIWRTPFESGDYIITLRVYDSEWRVDEQSISVEVE